MPCAGKNDCREADRQRAAAAAEARGAEAQRKIDRDKDIQLVEEELARLDALDRARRKVGRSENKLMFSSAVRGYFKSPSRSCTIVEVSN